VFVGTPGGSRALAVDPPAEPEAHDAFLVMTRARLKDVYRADAARHAMRGSSFLRATRHPALPVYVDRWIHHDPSQGPSLFVATRLVVARSAWWYLHDHRAPGRGLHPGVAARLVATAAEAIALAHERGTFHGAVGLQTLHVRADMTPLVIDFCSYSWHGRGGSDDARDILWGLHRALGFPSQGPSPEEDVFRLGATLAQLLTGHPPCRSETSDRAFYEAPSLHASIPPRSKRSSPARAIPRPAAAPPPPRWPPRCAPSSPPRRRRDPPAPRTSAPEISRRGPSGWRSTPTAPPISAPRCARSARGPCSRRSIKTGRSRRTPIS